MKDKMTTIRVQPKFELPVASTKKLRRKFLIRTTLVLDDCEADGLFDGDVEDLLQQRLTMLMESVRGHWASKNVSVEFDDTDIRLGKCSSVPVDECHGQSPALPTTTLRAAQQEHVFVPSISRNPSVGPPSCRVCGAHEGIKLHVTVNKLGRHKFQQVKGSGECALCARTKLYSQHPPVK